MNKDLRKLNKAAGYVLKESKRIVKRWHKKLPAVQLNPLMEAVISYEKAVQAEDLPSARQAFDQMDTLLRGEFAFARKSAFRDWAESLIVALAIALFLRAFVVEAFKIPSGSMIPTLRIGDHIFVNKFSYGIRLPIIGVRLVEFDTPKHGEIIVFVAPHEPDKDYIKRVIGVPGDTILVKGQELYVNGQKVMQSEPEPFTYFDESTEAERHVLAHDTVYGDAQFKTIYDPGRWHPTEEFKVKPDHYFVMGDNRDNSRDSRTGWQVPIDNVKGRALLVWWSSAPGAGIRFDRIGHLIE